MHQAVLTNESQRAAVTPKKAAPPVRSMSSNPTAGPFPQSQTKEPQEETSDVIKERSVPGHGHQERAFQGYKGRDADPAEHQVLRCSAEGALS